jgi:hypothetical protein
LSGNECNCFLFAFGASSIWDSGLVWDNIARICLFASPNSLVFEEFKEPAKASNAQQRTFEIDIFYCFAIEIISQKPNGKIEAAELFHAEKYFAPHWYCHAQMFAFCTSERISVDR